MPDRILTRGSPSLDGAAVAFGDTARERSVVIPSGDYTPPIWIRTEAGLVIRADTLPWRGVIPCRDIQVLSADPAGGPSLAFDSRWSNGTGNLQAAISDGGKWDFPPTSSQVLEVVSASEMSFAGTTNCLKVKWFPPGTSTHNVEKVIAVADLTSPLWRRHWMRVPSGQDWFNAALSPPGQGVFHPQNLVVSNIQLVFCNVIGVSLTQWRTEMRIASAGGPGGTGQRFPQLMTNLDYDTNYLVESETVIINADPLRIQSYPYVSTEGGTPLFDPDDYTVLGTGLTLPNWYAAGNYIDVVSAGARTPAQVARSFSYGHEGPAGASGAARHFWFAGVAAATSRIGTSLP